MMNYFVLGICGSPVKGGNTEVILQEAMNQIGSKEGFETRLIPLAGKGIGGCLHCNWCVKHQKEDKFCAQEDEMTPIYKEILRADALLIASPVHFGRLSGLTANMIDRLRAFVHGNVHEGRLRNKVGGALAVAFVRGGGIETTLSSINSAFFALQMIIAASRLYQLGAGALTSKDGKLRVERGARHMVLADDFGLMSARALAERVVELVRIVKAGRGVLGL